MQVKDLITALESLDPEAQVYVGHDQPVAAVTASSWDGRLYAVDEFWNDQLRDEMNPDGLTQTAR